MKKTITALLFIIPIVLLSKNLIFAQTTTPTPSPDNSGSSDIRQAIKEEVQKRLSESQTADTGPIAFVGTIVSLQATGNTIHLSTARQGDKIASASATAKIVRVDPAGNSRVVKLDNAAVGDNIIAMGNLENDGSLLAQRIILFTQVSPKRLVYLGNITEMTTKSVTLKPAKSDDKVTFTASYTTNIKKTDASGTATNLTLSALKTGDLIIIAGTQIQDKTAEADLIVRLASPATPSPSATP